MSSEHRSNENKPTEFGIGDHPISTTVRHRGYHHVLLQLRVLVFSRTAGFRHESIEAGIAALRKLAQEKGFEADFTEDPTEFSPDNLRQYDVVVFLNTTGDVLNREQEQAFEAFIRTGKGYVGVHGATDTEYDWPWYGQLAGAYFSGHPAIQEAVITIEDRSHPTTTMLPSKWTRTDEWYEFHTNPRGSVKILATVDERTYQGGSMGDDHPLMWCHEFDGGRSWYTALGHTPETFDEQPFLESLYEALKWTANKPETQG